MSTQMNTGELVQGISSLDEDERKRNWKKDFVLLIELDHTSTKIKLLKARTSDAETEGSPGKFGKDVLLKRFSTQREVDRGLWNKFKKNVEIIDTEEDEESGGKLWRKAVRGVRWLYGWYKNEEKWYVFSAQIRKWKDLEELLK